MAPYHPPHAGIVAAFDLDPASDIIHLQESVAEKTGESVFSPDFRFEVDSTLYQDGGIYRSIVKLLVYLAGSDSDNPEWYMGSGWLITPDIVVTAGHNVYKGDGNGSGKATVIECHIGYHGRESVGEGDTQTRYAKRCVTPAEWIYTSKDNSHRDFAFIQVDKPFTGNLRLFSYEKTPQTGIEMLGVVGYPGDRFIEDSHGKDWGAVMCKDSNRVGCRRKNTSTMLTYNISTYPGQSGSPVIREGTQTAIATHVCGSVKRNEASPITDYDNFLLVINGKMQKAHERKGGFALYDPTGRLKVTRAAVMRDGNKGRETPKTERDT